MNGKCLICDLMKDIKSAKIGFLKEQLTWHGFDKDEVNEVLSSLLERGVIYKKGNGFVELTETSIQN